VETREERAWGKAAPCADAAATRKGEASNEQRRLPMTRTPIGNKLGCRADIVKDITGEQIASFFG
jgi:hypothetical protein